MCIHFRDNNPCSDGILSETEQWEDDVFVKDSLNPYSNGLLSEFYKEKKLAEFSDVLILILMDYSLSDIPDDEYETVALS